MKLNGPLILVIRDFISDQNKEDTDSSKLEPPDEVPAGLLAAVQEANAAVTGNYPSCILNIH